MLFRSNSIILGSKSGTLFYLFQECGFSFFISICVFLVGIIGLIVSIFFRNLLGKDKAVIYLAWFQIFASIWMFSETGMGQFFLPNMMINNIFTYVGLCLMPVPLLLFIGEWKNYAGRRIMIGLAYLHILCAFIILYLDYN